MSILAQVKRYWFLLAVLFLTLLAGGVRTYRITEPLADWHSFRQADTASVTREFVKNGIDLLHPQYHDLANIQSGKDNLEGWRMVEFPLVNGIIAFLLRSFPSWDIVVTSRAASIVASLGALLALIFLVKRLHGPSAAVVAGTVFALMPYSIFYGRAILPEPFLICLALLAAASWLLWLEKGSRSFLWLVLSGVLFAAALLVKPMAVFFFPLFAGIWLQAAVAERRRLTPILLATGIFAASALPLLWWRNWIEQFPSGVPASDWLLNGNGIRLKPAWWRWLFADRIGRLMFGYWGAAILLFALPATFPSESVQKSTVKAKNAFLGISNFTSAWMKSGGAILGLTVGMLAYLVVFASGNVQHDYYQILLLPAVSWLWGVGAVWLVQRSRGVLEQLATLAVLGVIAGFSWFFAWYHVKDFFGIQNWAIVRAGQAVDRLAPENALVIAPYFGDTAFLFQTNRRGWPIGYDIPEKIQKGAQYYVSTAMDDEANQLKNTYVVLEQTDEYIVIDLTQPASASATME